MTPYTTDPCDTDAQLKTHTYLENIRVIAGKDDVSSLLKEVAGNSCLDISCIEHDLSYTDRPSWKHKKIVETAYHVVGVGILD